MIEVVYANLCHTGLLFFSSFSFPLAYFFKLECKLWFVLQHNKNEINTSKHPPRKIANARAVDSVDWNAKCWACPIFDLIFQGG